MGFDGSPSHCQFICPFDRFSIVHHRFNLFIGQGTIIESNLIHQAQKRFRVKHAFGESESQGVAFVVWTAVVTDCESSFLAIGIDKAFFVLGIPSNGYVMPLVIVNFIRLGTTNPIASPTDYFNRVGIGPY